MDEKLKKLLERLIRETVPLSQIASPYDTKFINVLVGVYRISLATLRDIYYLSPNPETGLSILDLSRKIVEYGIAIEYMVMKGKEDMAGRFQNHLWTDTHHQLEFLKSIGENPSNWDLDLKVGAEEAEKRYNELNCDARKDKSWAGKNLEQMMKELHDNRSLEEFDNSRIGEIYIWGNRANHPNPFTAINYLDKEGHDKYNGFSLRLGILAAMSFHIRLTTRYIDEIRSLSGKNDYQDLANNISAIRKELDDLGSNEVKI